MISPQIRARIEADPARWQTNGGNRNGTRDLTTEGHEILIAWDPIDQAWTAWEQTAGSCDEILI